LLWHAGVQGHTIAAKSLPEHLSGARQCGPKRATAVAVLGRACAWQSRPGIVTLLTAAAFGNTSATSGSRTTTLEFACNLCVPFEATRTYQPAFSVRRGFVEQRNQRIATRGGYARFEDIQP